MVDSRLRQQIRRQLDYPDARLRGRLAIDSTGPYSSRAGYMRVEVQKSAEEFLPAVPARNDTNAYLAGTFVNLRNEGGELVIYRVDAGQEIARGSNPMVSGGQNQDAFAYINTSQLNDFRTVETSPASAEVFVCPGFLLDGTYFAGALTTTLATVISGISAGNHLLACTFVRPDGVVEVTTSTEQSVLDPLDTTDLLECMQAATPGDIPSKALQLTAGQTSVDKDSFAYDLRRPIDAIATSRTLFVATEDVTVADTTSETSIVGAGVGDKTLRVNALRVGSTIRLTVRGFISDVGNPTLNIRVKLGSTTMVSTGAVALSAALSNADFSLEVLLTCRSIGASGTVVANGYFMYSNGTTLDMVTTTPTTIDTTITEEVGVTVEWGTANAGNTLSSQIVVIEQLI